MKKRIIFLLAFALLAGVSVQAQTYQEKLEEMEKRVKEKLDRQKMRVERSFANQMRRIWIEAQLYQGMEPPPVPKPVDPRIYDPAISFPDEDEQIKYVPLPSTPDPYRRDESPIDDPDPIEPLPGKPDDRLNPEPPVRAEAPPATSPLMENQIASLNSQLETSYFGRDVAMRYDSRMVFDPLRSLNENQIADLWLQLDASSYEPFLYQLGQEAGRMKLNDWGYAQLVNRTARELYPRDKNSRTLFNWFILSKTGYIATVCYDSDQLYLMLPSEEILYGKTFLKGKEGLKFYVIDLDGGDPDLARVRIFDHKYPDASRKLNLRLRQAPAFSPNPITKTLRFEYQGKEYKFPATLNRNLLNFYSSYPFMDLDVYMQAPLSEDARRSLLPSLKKAIQGMPEKESATFLLRFVQTAFGYKTDQEQFGRERYLFAEESLYFPYSDCEDRSVLYAYLVRELLGLEVVGLIFPGHAATAVKFRDRSIDGDYITYQGSKYIICDPTYINAGLGMCLPEYQNKQAKIVRI